MWGSLFAFVLHAFALLSMLFILYCVTHRYTHMCVRAHTHTHKHTHTYTHIHTQAHTQTSKHTHTNRRNSGLAWTLSSVLKLLHCHASLQQRLSMVEMKAIPVWKVRS